MKNLKKLLALMLVLVLALGMVPIVATASDDGFTDADDIEFVEAADVLKALGVIVGYTDGSYQPNQTVTRAEAMAYIVRMLLTPAVANRLPSGSSSFTDVLSNPSAAWASGIIEYAVSQGIALGRGDGIFDPQGAVTGVEMAAFLLRALGVGAYDNPATWAINAVADGTRMGIIDIDDDVDLTAPALRDFVGLYTFNSLIYSDDTDVLVTNTYYLVSDGTTGYDWDAEDNYVDEDIKAFIGTSSTSIEGITTWVSENFVDDGTDARIPRLGSDYTLTPYTLQESDVIKGKSLADLLYPRLTENNDPDAFGRPTRTWLLDGRPVSSVTVEDAIATYTTAVRLGTIYNALGLSRSANASVVKNGQAQPMATLERGSDDWLDRATSANGTLTEVFRVGGNITIVIVETFVGRVIEVRNATAARDRTVVIDIYSDAGLSETLNFVTDSFERDDIVLVELDRSEKNAAGNLTNDAVKNVQAAKLLENAAVSNFSTTHVTADGTRYVYGRHFNPELSTASVSLSGTFDFYLDNYDNVVHCAVYSAGGPLDFILVTDSQITGTAGTIGARQATYKVEVQAYALDGTSKVYELSGVRTATATTPSTTINYVGGGSVAEGHIYYTLGNSTYKIGQTNDGTPAGRAVDDPDAYQRAALLTALGKSGLSNARAFSHRMDGDRIVLSTTLSRDGTTFAAVGTANTINVKQNRTDVDGITNAFANANTTLVMVVSGRVNTLEGFARFPQGPGGAGYTFGAATAAAYLRTGSTITDILVIGDSTDGERTVEAFAAWVGSTGGTQTAADKDNPSQQTTEYRLWVDGALGWYQLTSGSDTPGDSEDGYYFEIETVGNKVKLTAFSHDVRYQVERRDSTGRGYLVFQRKAATSDVFASDVKIYDVSASSSADWSVGGTLSRGTWVVTESVNDEVAVIFIVPTPTAATATSLTLKQDVTGTMPSPPGSVLNTSWTVDGSGASKDDDVTLEVDFGAYPVVATTGSSITFNGEAYANDTSVKLIAGTNTFVVTVVALDYAPTVYTIRINGVKAS